MYVLEPLRRIKEWMKPGKAPPEGINPPGKGSGDSINPLEFSPEAPPEVQECNPEGERLEFLRAWMRGNSPGPHTLEIHPTYRCNLKCPYCQYHAARTRNELNLDAEMPIERWLALLDEAADLGVKEVYICGGGEPMVNPGYTLELMRRIKHHGLRGALLTNGTLFTREAARELVTLGWNRLGVSLDGPDAATHDSLRGVPGAFSRVSATLRWIAERKKELETGLPHVQLFFVIVAQNYTRIPEMVRFAHEHGAQELILLPLCSGGLDEEKYALTSEQGKECRSLAREALKLAEELNIKLSTDLLDISPGGCACSCQTSEANERTRPCDCDGTLRSAPCFEPWLYLQVHADGRIGPCYNSYLTTDPELRTKGLQDAWLGSEHLIRVRNSLLKWEFSESCRACGVHNLWLAKKMRAHL